MQGASDGEPLALLLLLKNDVHSLFIFLKVVQTVAAVRRNGILKVDTSMQVVCAMLFLEGKHKTIRRMGGERELGRYKSYKTAKALWKAVEDYFASISRVETVMEPQDTGEIDRYGHKIYEMIPALNGRKEEIKRTVYLLPPTVGGLTTHIGVSNSTWFRYCSEELHPEFAEVTEWATDRLKNWCFDELVVRPDKMTKGVMHNLEVNLQTTAKKSVEVTILGGDMQEMDDSALVELAKKVERSARNGT